MKKKKIIIAIVTIVISFIIFSVVFRNWDLLKDCILR